VCSRPRACSGHSALFSRHTLTFGAAQTQPGTMNLGCARDAGAVLLPSHAPDQQLRHPIARCAGRSRARRRPRAAACAAGGPSAPGASFGPEAAPLEHRVDMGRDGRSERPIGAASGPDRCRLAHPEPTPARRPLPAARRCLTTVSAENGGPAAQAHNRPRLRFQSFAAARHPLACSVPLRTLYAGAASLCRLPRSYTSTRTWRR
jgi:hypothetical protein